MDENEIIPESVLVAQKEAEEEAERNEIGKLYNDDDAALPVIPKLLQLPQEALVEKTNELKAKGKQLDLLFLKAESYSHFISENQKQSKIRLNAKKTASSEKKGKNKYKSSPQTVEFTQPPNLSGGILLPYQLDGLQWLLSLWENGLSGILADEMGLGKTIQVISLVAYLRYNNTPGPFFIAAPLAVISNWIVEFKKWLPSCPVLLYHGSKPEREQLRRKELLVSKQKDLNFPVVVTSFEICMIDRHHLEKYDWQYLILDEGHRIKNRNCRLVRELKSIKSVSRLLLTGTPIQNTLEELWSLLNFCSPMIFDDLRVFQAWFGFRNIGRETQVSDIVSDEQRESIVSKLHEILRPFLLRRMKKDVLIKMPPKKEIALYCGMTTTQREYYAHVQNNSIRDFLNGMGLQGAKDVSQLNMLMNLRKVCNHPFLFGEPCDERGKYLGDNPKLRIMASGKFKLLDRMLPKLKASGHKVVIFSQMTTLLDILEDYVREKRYEFCRLDGGTKLVDRQEGIDRFNKDPEVFVFLLSTRAGGLGVNLTSADTVILFDSDFNPHQDSQAQDRCHRIGQSRPVVVYRLLSAGSVEIDMMEKQISKKKLERLTIHGGDYRKAGARAGAALTIAGLKKLLEDDVKNLGRMSAAPRGSADSPENRDPGNGAAAAAETTTGSQGDALDCSRKSVAFDDISNEELSMVMNRRRLFAGEEFAGSIAFNENEEETSSPSMSPCSFTSPASSSSCSPRRKKQKKSSRSAGVRASADDTTRGCEETLVSHINQPMLMPIPVPIEGKMYDIIEMDVTAGVLQGL